MKKTSFVFSVLLCLASGAAFSQYSILHTFNGAAGQYPAGTLTLSGKTLFGTTEFGGKNDSGCIFSIDTAGANFKDIYDFGGTGNGAFPFGGSLKLAGKKLYGMTSGGGVNDSGCVFSIDTDGTGYTDLFDFSGTNGSNPNGSLILDGAKLFGMTYGGGTAHLGVIFTLDTLGHNYKNLYVFTGGTAGGNPFGDVTVIKDKLFGMTGNGGINGDGNIFSIDSNGTNYTDLYDFSGVDGDYPNNILTQVGKEFFGMTYSGGANSDGNIFSVDTDGTNFSDLLDFDDMYTPFGQYPYADVIFSNGYLYGTTSAGGANDSGTVFKVDTNGNYYTDLYDFAGTSNGDAPLGNVTITGKTLYGTTYTGGSTDNGVIFKINDTATTGVYNLKSQVSVKVYPNPGNGQFTIHSSVASGQWSVEVYDMLGEKVYSRLTANSSTFIVNLNQPNGVYLYRIIDENGNLINQGKLVIQK